jgi:ATP-binding cassette subfamily F protein uup
VAYYDQQREQLDPDRTVVDTIGEGNDTVKVNGQPRHVHGYLQDFLFSPERARLPVKALSGGERNRLLLARLLTRPANVLVLDEPTNDLDLDTLDLLEQQLVDWPGTLLVVSHDRRFLDNVVSSTIAFEGEGRVEEYVGGYEDYIRQKSRSGKSKSGSAKSAAAPDNSASGGDKSTSSKKKKRSFKEEREYSEIPGRIKALEDEQARLNVAIAQPEFYKEGADTIRQTLARVEAIDAELLDLMHRWDELDSLGK